MMFVPITLAMALGLPNPGPLASTHLQSQRSAAEGGASQAASREAVPASPNLGRDCIEVAEGTKEVRAFNPPGKSRHVFAFTVPAHSTLHVRLHHEKEAWIRLEMTNAMGWQEPGMAYNVLKTGNPEATYRNDHATPVKVFVLVADPTQVSGPKDPYLLKCEWKPQ